MAVERHTVSKWILIGDQRSSKLTDFKLTTTGCMKGGYDYNEEDQYEEPLDPSSTVDFHMKGLKGK